jgi:hypothetical protein
MNGAQGEDDSIGGAIFFSASSSPTVSGCTFDRSGAFHGGAIECQSGASPTFVACTFYANSAPGTGAGLRIWADCFPTLENSILAFGIAGEAVFCMAGGEATLTCSDLCGNEGGDWVGCIEDQADLNGNLSADPLFCDAGNGDLTIAEGSPCAPANNPACGLVGAWPVTCDVSPTVSTSWGRIRISYR